MKLLLVALLAGAGCSGSDKDVADSGDSGGDSGAGDSGDSGAGDSGADSGGDSGSLVDEDRDGYTSDVDCEDNDYRIYPGAPEACDGIDNDCDEAIDEDFDADEDGYTSAALCDDGTDCDDARATVHPDATETPYDGIDQDCDGADLRDVDGDGREGADVGGSDCDDTDASVYPGAPETPFDGIDQDCDGVDSGDGDGDGYDAESVGGDDCDDADPGVHPDAIDFSGDGIDADCDGRDGETLRLADAEVIVTGVSGSGDLLGYDVAACDLDEDGLDDLIVAAPFGSTYQGQVGIWYGADADAWTATLAIEDADTVITGASKFIGFGVECADVDGDGHQDLVMGRGEIDYTSSYQTDFGVIVHYGDGWPLDAATDESGDVELTLTLGVTANVPTVYSPAFTAADVDGDGAAEILTYIALDDGYANGDSSLHVVPGARYTRDGSFDAQSGATQIPSDDPDVFGSIGVVPDVTGDGIADVVLGEPGRATADAVPDDTGYTPRAGLLAVVSWDAAAGTLESMSGTWLWGSDDDLFGWSSEVGDFDGDGASEVVVGAVGYAAEASYGGGVYAFDAPASFLGGGELLAADHAVAALAGPYEGGVLGWAMASGGDSDGDGAADLLVAEPSGSASAVGRMLLLSGARMMAGEALDDAALLTWQGEDANGSTGIQVVSGDFDGDGRADYVVPTYLYLTTSGSSSFYTGRTYVILTSRWGL